MAVVDSEQKKEGESVRRRGKRNLFLVADTLRGVEGVFEDAISRERLETGYMKEMERREGVTGDAAKPERFPSEAVSY